MIPRLRRRFERWAMEPAAVTGAVIFRVLLALWTAAYFAPRLPHLAEIWCRPVLRSAAPPLQWIGDPVPPVLLVQALIALLFAALVAFAAGYRARLAHGVVVLCLLALFAFDTQLVRAYGWIALLDWGLLWFLPYDRLRDADGKIRSEPAWGARLLMIQFASIYPLSVLAKLTEGTQWLDGRAVSHIASSPDWGLFGVTASGISDELGLVLGWATLALESFIGLGLWGRRTRPWAMLGVVLFHLGLAVSLRISILFGLLMCAHLVLFVDWRRLSR